jgi:transposase
VRIPSIDEEDLRRSHRERSRLVRERTAHINRIKGLLFAQGIWGINVKSQYKTSLSWPLRVKSRMRSTHA